MFGTVSRSEDPLAEVVRSNVQLPDAIEQLERRMILEGLLRTGWNKTQTAKELGVSRRNLIRKVAAYELEKDRD
jgi:DNA-binding NtrC family response regulator